MAITAPLQAQVVKANNNDNLDLGSSWTGGTAPFRSSIVKWDSTVTSASNVTWGQVSPINTIQWQGIIVTSPGGPIIISEPAGPNFFLDLDTGGIDMHAATQDLTINLVGDSSIGIFQLSAPQIWNVASGRTLSISANVQSGIPNTITKTGGGTLTLGLEGSLAGIILAEGTLNFNNAGAPLTIDAGTTIDNTSGAYAALGSSPYPQIWNGNFTFGGSNRFDLGTGAVTMNDNVEITLKGSVLMEGGSISGPGFALAINGTGSLALWGNDTYDGGTILRGGTLGINSNGTSTTSPIGTGPLIFSGGDLDNSNATLESLVSLGTNNSQVWDADFTYIGSNYLNLGTGAVTMTGNRTVTTLARSLTVGGVIDDNNGGFRLTKDGAGVLILSGANTYHGGTQIIGGEIEFSTPNNFGSGPLSLAGGGVRWAANTTLDISPNIVNFDTGTDFFDTNSNNITLASPIAGNGTLVKAGFGILTLAGANSYIGGTTITGGTLRLAGASAMGDSVGGLKIVNGTLDLNSTNISVGFLSSNFSSPGAFGLAPISITDSSSGIATTMLTVNNTIDSSYGGVFVNGSAKSLELIKAGPGNLTFTNHPPPTLVINDGAFILASANGFETSNITDNSSLIIFAPTGAFQMLRGSISGNGSVTLAASNLTFSNNVTYSGDTTISSGTLTIFVSVAALTGNFIVNGNLDFQQFHDDSFHGSITGNGSITYVGSPTSTLTLSGNNTFTGNTTVNLGTLNFTNGFISADGANLSGVGNIGGAVTINGALLPGSSGQPGLLTFQQDLNLGANSSTTLQVSSISQYSMVHAAGNLTLGGTIALTFLNGFAPTPGLSFGFFQAGNGIAGSFSNVSLPTLNRNLTWNTSQLATTGAITAAAINYSQWTAVVGLSGNNALPAAHSFDGGPPNVIRYAMNLDTSPAPTGAPTLSAQNISGTNFLTIQYRVRKNMTDYQLVPQYSTDLATWTDVDAGSISQQADADIYTSSFQASTALLDDGPVFLRVVAEPLP